MSVIKNFPVNAPDAVSAIIAVETELPKWDITIEGSPFAFPAARQLPDDQVLLTVTKPTGPRSTILVQVNVLTYKGKPIGRTDLDLD